MKHSFGQPPDGVDVNKKKKKPQSSNETIIRGAMKDKGLRGNPRNYVLLLDDRMLDCSGSFTMYKTNDKGEIENKIDFEGVKLVHKRDLYKYAAEVVAAKFWNRKSGVRIPQKKEVNR